MLTITLEGDRTGKVRNGEDAIASTRDACATHSSITDHRFLTAAEQGEAAASGEAAELDAADWEA